MGTLQADTITNGAGTGAPSFTYGISGTVPTQQRFTSGSGTYTTPANVKWLKVEMIGGGAGGNGGGNQGTHGQGAAGGGTTFGTSLLTANGAGAGSGSGTGAGGTATIASPAYGRATSGAKGTTGFQINQAAGLVGCGITGASTPFGGGGAGSSQNDSGAGYAAVANTGAGGGGGACNGGNALTSYDGAGGSAGGYISAIVPTPSSTYAYSVGASGAGGSAGTAGFVGGAGGSGYIEVTEYYA